MRANLRLFTALWNDERIETFKKGPLKSLLWPKNKQVLEGATWDVWTKKEHVDELERLFFNAVDCKVETHLLPDLKDGNGRDAPAPYMLHQPILTQMVTCLNTQSKMLMLPPDTIFGEGTLPNIMKLGQDPSICVAVPHVRVAPHILHAFTEDRPYSNQELARASFGEALHQSWVEAERGHPKYNSFWSGVCWDKCGDGLVSVTHRVPTVYLASFTGQDHAFWQMQQSFGSWDHRWPGECLIRQSRQRLPGSSDLCMIAEITGIGDNIPPATPPEVVAQGNPPDYFWTDTLHGEHNRQTQFIVRT